MTFWEHLDELRKVIFKSAIVIVVLTVIFFINKKFVFDTLILAPSKGDFILWRILEKISYLMRYESDFTNFNLKLINFELSSQFFIHVSTSITLAIIVSVPLIFYQIWSFIKPALYVKERIAVRKAFMFSTVLFFVGVVVSYIMVFPLTIRFLGTYQVSEEIVNTISLQSYISMFTWLTLIMGVVFEMPALAAILSRIGLISKSFLKKYRKHAFVILILLAAIITPSGDAFTLFIVGLPLYFLYELSIIVSRDINQ